METKIVQGSLSEATSKTTITQNGASDRVSLHGINPEDALKALLRTPREESATGEGRD